jgi:predicted DNA-binding transcriptional regulator YafY
VQFTKEEATAFLTAEKLVNKLTDESTREMYHSALYKIKSVLRAAEKDHLELLDHRIEVLGNAYLPKDINHTNALQPLLRSISERAVVRIQYFAHHSQEHTIREIEPVGLFLQGSFWHLIAWCRLRNDYRHFRTDRISKLEFTDQHFHKEHPSLATFLKKVSEEKELDTVVMIMDKDKIRFLGDQKFYNGFVSERELGGRMELTFLTGSIEGFARWYLMFADVADIVQPQKLQTRIKELITFLSSK